MRVTEKSEELRSSNKILLTYIYMLKKYISRVHLCVGAGEAFTSREEKRNKHN